MKQTGMTLLQILGLVFILGVIATVIVYNV
jgi:hypothetical protein